MTITEDTGALEAWENEGGAYLPEQDRTEESAQEWAHAYDQRCQAAARRRDAVGPAAQTTTYAPPWPPEARGVPEWWDANVEGRMVRLTHAGGCLEGIADEVCASGVLVDGVPVRWGEIRGLTVR